MLASGSLDITTKIWNINTGGLMKNLTGHDDMIEAIAFDSTYLLASGSYEWTVKF